MGILSEGVKLIGKLACPLPQIKFEDYIKIKDKARSGDVLLSRRPGSLSNFFIDGHYKHAGVIHMNMIIEAKFIGVVKTMLVDFCMKKDAICLVRPKANFGPVITNKVIEKAVSIIGSKYDFTFTRGGNEYYCSEVIEHAWGQYIEVPKKRVLNKNILNPSDLLKSPKWEKIIEINQES